MIDRKTYIGGSDTYQIVKGEWAPLIAEKRGEAAPEDLSGVFQVQLGTYTEPFNVEWFEKVTGLAVTNRNKFFRHNNIEFMGATVDGLLETDTLFEAKHTSSGRTIHEMVNVYYSQLQHNMAVCGLQEAYLSVIIGNRYDYCLVEYDEDYVKWLIDLENTFWAAVKSGTYENPEPTEPKKKIVIDGMREVDMTQNNEWGDLEFRYSVTAEAAKEFEDCKKALKGLVEDDVRRAHGKLIAIERDKRGAMRFKEI